MTSHSPPLSRIIPIFLWLKLKETWGIWALALLHFLIARPIAHSEWWLGFWEEYAGVPSIMGWFDWLFVYIMTYGSMFLAGCILFLIISSALSIIDWLRSNWQQATRIAMAREKGR